MANTILVYLDEAEMDQIPKPRGRWVAGVVRAELAKVRRDIFGKEIKDWAFVIGGKFMTAPGSDKMSALLSLGYTKEQAVSGIVSKHDTVEKAKEGGWYPTSSNSSNSSNKDLAEGETNPLDV